MARASPCQAGFCQFGKARRAAPGLAPETRARPGASGVAAVAPALHNPRAMLRRALLLACLMAPLGAEAADVTFSDPGPFLVSECQADPSMTITWTVTTTSVIEASSTYRILALRSGDAGCAITTVVDGASDSQVIVKGLAAHVGTSGKTPSATYPGYGGTSTNTLNLSDVVAAAGATCAGAANQTITVCVQLLMGDGSYVTSSSGTLTLEREPPAPPRNVTVAPGDHALIASWDAPTTSNTEVSRYRAEAYACTDAAGTTCSSTVTASATTGNATSRSVRISGLTVGTTYKVFVYAVSAKGVDSTPAGPALGVPIETFDYWERYQGMDGPEQGGCAGGPAGALSLLALAAAAALRRRRP